MDEIKLKSPFNAKNPRVASVFSSMADQMNYKCLLIQKHIKMPDKIKYLKNNDRTVKRIRKFIRGQKMPPKSKNPKSLQKVLKFKVFLGKPAHLWLPRSSNIIGRPPTEAGIRVCTKWQVKHESFTQSKKPKDQL